MAKENDIKNELFKQMEKDSGKLPSDGDSLRRIFDKDAVRTKRMKWITVVSWVLVIVFFIITGIMEYSIKSTGNNLAPQNVTWLNVMVFIFRPLLVLAIFFSISFYIRSRSLSIKQIQIKLLEIEDAIKKMPPN